MKYILFLVIVGCNASGRVVIGDKDVEPTAEPSTDTAGEPSEEPNEPTNEPEPTDEPPPEVESNKEWSGTRIVTFPLNDYCVDSLSETGIEITRDESALPYKARCETCREFYLLSLDPVLLCYETVTFGESVVVGIEDGFAGVSLYVFSTANNGDVGVERTVLLDADGDGWKYSFDAEYDYFGTLYPYIVEGEFTTTETSQAN
ncbi:MAG: hypothetical protein VX278_10835 [Myxococcota bacterium]|nr:hypothetical protein [Myxococcota bacterium]